MGGWRWIALALLAMGSCRRAAPPPRPAPARVTAYTVEPRPVSIPQEYVGQVVASREVALLAHVTGYLQKQAFQDGARVRAGDLLFVIDPRPFQAALDQARANLLQARSALAKATRDVERFAPLVKDRALPRQNLDDARAARQQAAAAVEAQRAALETAQLDLQYTQVRSPVDGRIGRAQVFPGALVTAGQTALATVSTIDPAQVQFSLSELDYLRLAPRLTGQGQLGTPVRLLLPDGKAYPHPGRIDFADRAIATQTGTFGMRASFPNPEELLRPGMFARVEVMEDLPSGLLVPSAAVQQVLASTSVLVVGPGDVVEPRNVALGPGVGSFRVVRSGLSPGDRVVVGGLAQARPGARVAVSAAAIPPAAQGTGQGTQGSGSGSR